jgi:hypothetical protein
MDMKKEQQTIDGMCEDVTDAYIGILIEGKDILSIGDILRKDLIVRDFNLAGKWDGFYAKQPSCKSIQEVDKYFAAMKEKYIKVYKLCLGLIKEDYQEQKPQAL